MSNLTRVAVVAAAVVAVVIGTIRLLPVATVPGATAPSPTPGVTSSPTSTPTPMPTPRPAFVPPGALEPGTYLYDGAAGTYLSNPATFFTVTVPAGWGSFREVSIWKHANEAGEVDFEAWDVTHVFTDACQWDEINGMPPAGATAAELATQLANQKARVASPITDVVVDGVAAKRIEFTNDPSIDVTKCTSGGIRLWPGAGPDLHGGECCFTKQTVQQLTILDRDGHHLVIVAAHQPAATAADLAELNAVVESIRWTSPGASAAP